MARLEGGGLVGLTVGYEAAEVSSDDAMPGGAFAAVELGGC